MKPADAAIAALGTAQSLLLEPYGLTEQHLHGALGDIFQHRVDFADLYFQYTRSEAWSLDEGIVKSGSFSIDQGVGVRAVSGDKTAFAYSDVLSPQALREAAVTTRAIARAGQSAKTKLAASTKLSVPPTILYGDSDPLAALSSQDKVDLLGRVERLARSKDRRVTQGMASLAG
jgi:TldD protein